MGSYALKTKLLGFGALRPFLSSYALKTELLSYWAPWLFGLPKQLCSKTKLLGSRALRPFLSNYALKTQLLGFEALRPFHLPSLGKVCVALMRIYGELGQIARLPKCHGFLINSGPSVVGLCFLNFVLSLAESESTHAGA